MRMGIFGGSFDPVHLGHLWIAEAAIETLQLDSLRWIPAATSPLKRDGTVASDELRLQMLRLAIAGADQHILDDREIRRGEISYTVDTLAELRSEFPNADLFLVIGSDSLATMQKWHRPTELMKMATLSVVQRGGDNDIDFGVVRDLASAETIDRCRDSIIRMPVIQISSSEIRERIASRRSIRYRVPHPVAALIDNEDCYRN